jgi:hypothetical protein
MIRTGITLMTTAADSAPKSTDQRAWEAKAAAPWVTTWLSRFVFRATGSRNWFQSNQVQDRDGRQTQLGHRQHHLEERARLASAIDRSRLGDRLRQRPDEGERKNTVKGTRTRRGSG